MCIELYMLHIKTYKNYADNQESSFCMNNKGLTGKYIVKITCS